MVHEMHGRMHHNHCQITNLLAHDPLSSLAYPMMTHTLPLASNYPIKTLVARQLPTNVYIGALGSYVHVQLYEVHTCMHIYGCFGYMHEVWVLCVS